MTERVPECLDCGGYVVPRPTTFEDACECEKPKIVDEESQ